MPITDQDAIDFGFLVAFAESMAVPNQTQPRNEPRIGAAGWDVVGHLLAQDSILPQRAALAAGAPKSIRPGITVFYGYLARNRTDQNAYAVAIRGTIGFAEFVIDAEFFPRDAPSSPGAKVERGFWSIYESMTLVGLDGAKIGAKAADGIAKVVGAGTVTIAGHSLGAALATYLSFDVAKLLGARSSACLFASPRTGDHVWAAGYDATVGTYRLFNYVLDVVPYVPFDAPPIQYSTLARVTILQPSTAEAEVRFDITCNHNLVCYCAMIDFPDTKSRLDPQDTEAMRCIVGPPTFSLNFELTNVLATAVNALGGAGSEIVRMLWVAARAKGEHV